MKHILLALALVATSTTAHAGLRSDYPVTKEAETWLGLECFKVAKRSTSEARQKQIGNVIDKVEARKSKSAQGHYYALVYTTVKSPWGAKQQIRAECNFDPITFKVISWADWKLVEQS